MATKKVQPTVKRKKRKKAQKNNKRIILFVVEMIVLVILLVVLYMVLKADKVNKVSIDKENIVVNETVENNVALKDTIGRGVVKHNALHEFQTLSIVSEETELNNFIISSDVG